MRVKTYTATAAQRDGLERSRAGIEPASRAMTRSIGRPGQDELGEVAHGETTDPFGVGSPSPYLACGYVADPHTTPIRPSCVGSERTELCRWQPVSRQSAIGRSSALPVSLALRRQSRKQRRCFGWQTLLGTYLRRRPVSRSVRARRNARRTIRDGPTLRPWRPIGIESTPYTQMVGHCHAYSQNFS